ncbi:acyl-CoA reductase [Shewanella waksmanii]|uniref:acyl-CoA reductase n=1 Tax=Shewanella waksmanii TaxID=213783 RepID=UPI003735ABCF
MQRHFPVKDVKFIDETLSWDEFKVEPFESFDEASISFVSALSLVLLNLGKVSPNLSSLGFFLRESSIRSLKDKYSGQIQGRGLSFHLSPSNVPTVAVFSWLSSLLSGCSAIVRVNSNLSNEQKLLMTLTKGLLSSHPVIQNRVRFIQYSHSDELNQNFSAISDVRLLWGGDETITLFSSYQISDRCKDLCFGDRQSFAIVDLDFFYKQGLKEQKRLASALANDIITYNQQACSSPSLIVTYGSGVGLENFQCLMSKELEETAITKPHAYEQLVNAQYLGMTNSGLRMKTVSTWNWLRLPTERITKNLKPQSGNLLYRHTELCLLDRFRFDSKPQTCVLIGDEKIKQLVSKRILADRYVRAGHALAHDWVWDGIDLIKQQSISECERC